MGPNGEDPRKIVTADRGEFIDNVAWSPNSQRIAYERLGWGTTGARGSIESRDLKGDQLTLILSDPKLAVAYGGGLLLVSGWTANLLTGRRVHSNKPDSGYAGG